MTLRFPHRLALALTVATILLLPSTARATDVMCDPSYQDCRATLLSYIRNETQSASTSRCGSWKTRRWPTRSSSGSRSGVSVRALVDPRRNTTTPMNAVILAQFQQAGIPMRQKVGGGIMHWKYMIFNGRTSCSGAPPTTATTTSSRSVPYLDYTDEGIYFTNDPPVIDSFRRKFDDAWLDTVALRATTRTSAARRRRRYPLYPIDSIMSFVPAENFSTRSKPLYDAETQRIDVIMYKITEAHPCRRPDPRGQARHSGAADHRAGALSKSGERLARLSGRSALHGGRADPPSRARRLHAIRRTRCSTARALAIFGSSNWTLGVEQVAVRAQLLHDQAVVLRLDQGATSSASGATLPATPKPRRSCRCRRACRSTSRRRTAPATSRRRRPTISWKPGPWAHSRRRATSARRRRRRCSPPTSRSRPTRRRPTRCRRSRPGRRITGRS